MNESEEVFSPVKHDLISDRFKGTVVALGGLNSLMAIVVNTSLLIVILSDSGLRRSIFMWNICSLCISGLLSGCFIIPLNTSRFDREQWVHGPVVCKVLVILDYVQLSLPAVALASTGLNRILKLQREANPTLHTQCYQTNILQYILFVSPWVYTFCVCVPILIAAESNSDYHSVFKDICFYVLKAGFMLPMFILMMVLPTFLLMCSTSTLIMYYNIKSISWRRMPSTGTGSMDNADVVGTVRSTVFVTVIASAIFMFCWAPDLVVIFQAIACSTWSCYPSESTYLSTYTTSCSASFLSQIPWFLITDIRLRMHELWLTFLSKSRYLFERCRRCCCHIPMSVSWRNNNQALLMEGSDLM